MRAQDLPAFNDMSPVKGMPQGTAWGLFDKNGERDNCGTLNLLKPENTLEASKEIKSGRSVALKSLGSPIHIPLLQQPPPLPGAHKNGIEAWTTCGIVGRGILIDYVAYAQRRNISYLPVSRHGISIETIEEIAREQGVIFRQADILIVRSEFVKWYEEAGAEERIQSVKNAHESAGVKRCKETVEWIWNGHFPAVAGDTVGFGCSPPAEKHSEWVLHDWLLALL
ncbi:hypothetical protein OCU04_005236 [Sclerotinia nivalis]|uniref:Uncharacterized protein n=1 Tax=Sclerotinia nivalis TaxID=352851 RepID=A0A9X0ANY1_9HELO|nr:hypothetical protein OCU04_005236 [Sclerotinia nivalis]